MQRRRDRINEKMRALQELIPRCNKVCHVYDFSLYFHLALRIVFPDLVITLSQLTLCIFLSLSQTRLQCWMKQLSTWSHFSCKFRYVFAYSQWYVRLYSLSKDVRFTTISKAVPWNVLMGIVLLSNIVV